MTLDYNIVFCRSDSFKFVAVSPQILNNLNRTFNFIIYEC